MDMTDPSFFAAVKLPPFDKKGPHDEKQAPEAMLPLQSSSSASLTTKQKKVNVHAPASVKLPNKEVVTSKVDVPEEEEEKDEDDTGNVALKGGEQDEDENEGEPPAEEENEEEGILESDTGIRAEGEEAESEEENSGTPIKISSTSTKASDKTNSKDTKTKTSKQPKQKISAQEESKPKLKGVKTAVQSNAPKKGILKKNPNLNHEIASAIPQSPIYIPTEDIDDVGETKPAKARVRKTPVDKKPKVKEQPKTPLPAKSKKRAKKDDGEDLEDQARNDSKKTTASKRKTPTDTDGRLKPKKQKEDTAIVDGKPKKASRKAIELPAASENDEDESVVRSAQRKAVPSSKRQRVQAPLPSADNSAEDEEEEEEEKEEQEAVSLKLHKKTPKSKPKPKHHKQEVLSNSEHSEQESDNNNYQHGKTPTDAPSSDQEGQESDNETLHLLPSSSKRSSQKHTENQSESSQRMTSKTKEQPQSQPKTKPSATPLQKGFDLKLNKAESFLAVAPTFQFSKVITDFLERTEKLCSHAESTPSRGLKSLACKVQKAKANFVERFQEVALSNGIESLNAATLSTY